MAAAAVLVVRSAPDYSVADDNAFHFGTSVQKQILSAAVGRAACRAMIESFDPMTILWKPHSRSMCGQWIGVYIVVAPAALILCEKVNCKPHAEC